VDRDGKPSAAYLFDGVDDALIIRNHPSLAFEEAATVALWVRPTAAPDRESFLVSHGSWQDRWKISLTPDQVVRWTVNTSNAITDLDVPTPLAMDSLYHIAATYGGGEMKVYVDGGLRASTIATGALNPTSHDLTIAQMLPGDAQYNFAGVIDDVRIYNRALSPHEILTLFDGSTGTDGVRRGGVESAIQSNYPNPFTTSTTVPFTLAEAGRVRISVFDLTGRRVRSLLDDRLPAGRHSVEWRPDERRSLSSGVYVIRFEAVGRVQHLKVTRL